MNIIGVDHSLRKETAIVILNVTTGDVSAFEKKAILRTPVELETHINELIETFKPVYSVYIDLGGPIHPFMRWAWTCADWYTPIHDRSTKEGLLLFLTASIEHGDIVLPREIIDDEDLIFAAALAWNGKNRGTGISFV